MEKIFALKTIRQSKHVCYGLYSVHKYHAWEDKRHFSTIIEEETLEELGKSIAHDYSLDDLVFQIPPDVENPSFFIHTDLKVERLQMSQEEQTRLRRVMQMESKCH